MLSHITSIQKIFSKFLNLRNNFSNCIDLHVAVLKRDKIIGTITENEAPLRAESLHKKLEAFLLIVTDFLIYQMALLKNFVAFCLTKTPPYIYIIIIIIIIIMSCHQHGYP